MTDQQPITAEAMARPNWRAEADSGIGAISDHVFSVLAPSIARAFSGLVAARWDGERLTLAAQGREVIFDGSGATVGASNAPHSRV